MPDPVWTEEPLRYGGEYFTYDFQCISEAWCGYDCDWSGYDSPCNMFEEEPLVYGTVT